MPSSDSVAIKQENVCSYPIDNGNLNEQLSDSLCIGNVDVNTSKQKVDNSKIISHDDTSINKIDQTGRLQNACSMPFLSRYKLSDCSHVVSCLITNCLTVLINSLLHPFLNGLLEPMKLSKERVFSIIKGLA